MYSKLLWVASLIALAVIPGAAQGSVQNELKVDASNRTLAVSAEGEVSVEPEIAVLHVGFETQPGDAKSVYEDGARTSNAIIAALKGVKHVFCSVSGKREHRAIVVTAAALRSCSIKISVAVRNQSAVRKSPIGAPSESVQHRFGSIRRQFEYCAAALITLAFCSTAPACCRTIVVPGVVGIQCPHRAGAIATTLEGVKNFLATAC